MQEAASGSSSEGPGGANVSADRYRASTLFGSDVAGVPSEAPANVGGVIADGAAMDQPLPVPGVDPSSVATQADFAACLNGLRKRRDLSYEAMEAASRGMLSRRGGDRWQLLSKSTIGEIVNGERLPSRDRLLTFLAVCELTPADQFQWIAAWERVSALGAAPRTDLALPRHVLQSLFSGL